MAGFSGQTEINTNDTFEDLEDSLEKGLKRAANSLSGIGKNAGKDKIANSGRVWRPVLINSFTTDRTKKNNGGQRVRLTNTAEHAATVDEGRDRGAEKPPVAALIPWVLDHFGRYHKQHGPRRPPDNDSNNINNTANTDDDNTNFGESEKKDYRIQFKGRSRSFAEGEARAAFTGSEEAREVFDRFETVLAIRSEKEAQEVRRILNRVLEERSDRVDKNMERYLDRVLGQLKQIEAKHRKDAIDVKVQFPRIEESTVNIDADKFIKPENNNFPGNYQDTFVGQRLIVDAPDGGLRDLPDIVEGKIIGIDTGVYKIKIRGEKGGIFIDPKKDNPEWGVLALERWESKPRADQRDNIMRAYDNVPNGGTATEVDGMLSGLSQDWKQDLDDTFERMLDNTLQTYQMKKMVDRLEAFADYSHQPNNDSAGNVTQSNGGNVKVSQGWVLAMRESSPQTHGTHENTMSHEFMHTWLFGNFLGYNKNHAKGYTQGQPLPFEFGPDGEAKRLDHDDAYHFMLHDYSDHKLIDSNDSDNAPIGYDNIIDDVDDQIKNTDWSNKIIMEETAKDYDDDVNTATEAEMFDLDDGRIEQGDYINISPANDNSGMNIETWEVASDGVIRTATGNPNGLVVIDRASQDSKRIDVDKDTHELVNYDFLSVRRPPGHNADTSYQEAQSYLKTDMNDEPVKAFAEAVNRAWYAQVRFQDKSKFNKLSHEQKIISVRGDSYSTINAHETATTIHGAMMSVTSKRRKGTWYSRKSDVKQALHSHPYLVVAWLNLFEPSDAAEEALPDGLLDDLDDALDNRGI
jgi:hypothetical protein